MQLSTRTPFDPNIGKSRATVRRFRRPMLLWVPYHPSQSVGDVLGTFVLDNDTSMIAPLTVTITVYGEQVLTEAMESGAMEVR